MKVAVVSLNQTWEDKEENFRLCESYVQVASRNSVDLVLFPEMTLTGFSTNIERIAEPEDGSATVGKFQALAKKHRVSIHFGVVIEGGNKAYNNSVMINNEGDVIASYSKIHPFTFAQEDKFFHAGGKLSIASIDGVKFGLTICYDLRFPEIYSMLAKECDVIINIANWPCKRIDHWDTLLKARAIENQVFIIGVNRTGVDGNNHVYVKSSSVFNANGESLSGLEEKNMDIFEIKKAWTEEYKNSFETFRDRRNTFYKDIA